MKIIRSDAHTFPLSFPLLRLSQSLSIYLDPFLLSRGSVKLNSLVARTFLGGRARSRRQICCATTAVGKYERWIFKGIQHNNTKRVRPLAHRRPGALDLINGRFIESSRQRQRDALHRTRVNTITLVRIKMLRVDRSGRESWCGGKLLLRSSGRIPYVHISCVTYDGVTGMGGGFRVTNTPPPSETPLLSCKICATVLRHRCNSVTCHR
jgi:hypothetical protein